MTSGPRGACLQVCCRHIQWVGDGWGRRAHHVQPEGSRSAGRRWKARAADNHIPASESESNRWVQSQEVVNRWNAQEVGVCGIAWACIRGVGRTRWQKERSAHDAPSSKIFLGHNPLGRKPPPYLWKLTLAAHAHENPASRPFRARGPEGGVDSDV